jgi:endonuclease VIII
MPEGHTIHRAARDHHKLFAKQTVAVSSPQGRFADSAARLNGQQFVKAEAYGKHLFHWWEDGSIVHIHLGLFGKFRVQKTDEPEPPRGEIRMRMEAPKATLDLSGPTECLITTEDHRDQILQRLGPDPLRTDADPELFYRRVAKSSARIGTLLMDQSVAAGIGNVYRAEALFVNGIHPNRLGKALADGEREALWATMVSMLSDGVRSGRIITVDKQDLDVPRSKLKRGDANYVYHRDHCFRCGSAIQKWDLQGRWCYACPSCQPA